MVVERKEADSQVFVSLGPRMDASPADPYEGTLLYDEPGVRAYIFAQRVHAIAHFLRATHGIGAVIDRKSTRLNSSHGYISYAVFCLKKNKTADRSQHLVT